jgi:hypothetical protein
VGILRCTCLAGDDFSRAELPSWVSLLLTYHRSERLSGPLRDRRLTELASRVYQSIPLCEAFLQQNRRLPALFL